MTSDNRDLLPLLYHLDHLEPLYDETRRWVQQTFDEEPLVFYQPAPLEDLGANRHDHARSHVLSGTADLAEKRSLEDFRKNQTGLLDLNHDLLHLTEGNRWLGAIETADEITGELDARLQDLSRILDLGARYHQHRSSSGFNKWLLNLHRSLIGPKDFEGLLERLFDGLMDQLSVERIGYYSPRGQDFELVSHRGLSDELNNRSLIARQELLEQGLGDQVAITLNNTDEPLVLVPLETGEDLVGLIGFINPPWGKGTSNHVISRLEALRTVVALVVHSFQLQHSPEESIIEDQLTGLKTPDYFRNRLSQEINRGERYGPACSLMMLDVDHFEKINNELGFKAGENTLREFGRLIKTTFRTIDLACRFDNDQFAVMFPNTSTQEALVAAQRLLEVAREPFLKFQGEPIGIRFSAGLASFPDDGDSTEELFKQAKLALYEAKQTGKDQVITARDLE